MSIRLGGRTGVIATLFVAMAWLALPDRPAGAPSAQATEFPRTLEIFTTTVTKGPKKDLWFWGFVDLGIGRL